MKAVVLSGRRRLARVLAGGHVLDDARALRAGERGVRLGLLPELVGGVVRLERAVGMLELREDLPEGLRHVGAALELALDDQAEARALDAADGKEVGAEAARGEGDRAGERGAPDQVDVLAGGAGVGELVGEVVELGERALDLVLRERGVAGALDGRALLDQPVDDLGVRLHRLLERLVADQLALAVEVGRDHDGVRFLGQLADRLDHVLVGRLGDERRVDQVVEVRLLPVRVLVREGDAHHVTLEPDGPMIALGIAPCIERNLVGGVVFRRAGAQDVRDLFRGVVLLSDDQAHRRRE